MESRALVQRGIRKRFPQQELSVVPHVFSIGHSSTEPTHEYEKVRDSSSLLSGSFQHWKSSGFCWVQISETTSIWTSLTSGVDSPVCCRVKTMLKDVLPYSMNW